MNIKLIQEISTRELQRSTEKAFGDDRANKKVSGMSNGPITYTVVSEDGTSGLLCVTKVKNAKTKSENTCKILLEGLNVTDEDNSIELVTTSGNINIIPFPDNSDTKISCTCMDFRFRFADVNKKNDALFGKSPPPYVRKTTTRPPVNPSSAPGMCKHLYKFFDVLEIEGII